MEYDKSELLEETYRLARANNKMLRRMRRAAWIGGIAKIIFWALMIGLPVWFYYQYAQPVVGQLLETMTQVQGASEQLQQVGGSLKQLKGLDQGAIKKSLELLNSIPGIQAPSGQ